MYVQHCLPQTKPMTKAQQAAQNQKTEAQKISQTSKLQLVGIHNKKKSKLHMKFSTVPDDGCTC